VPSWRVIYLIASPFCPDLCIQFHFFPTDVSRNRYTFLFLPCTICIVVRPNTLTVSPWAMANHWILEQENWSINTRKVSPSGIGRLQSVSSQCASPTVCESELFINKGPCCLVRSWVIQVVTESPDFYATKRPFAVFIRPASWFDLTPL
jgi:hypothetical protein